MKLVDADTKKQLKNVHDLYEEAFPKSEKKPFQMILEGREKGNYGIMAIEGEKGEFLGLAITMHYKELVLLDYFAIDSGCRGTGVGGEALRELQRRYAGKKFLLEIESTVGHGDGNNKDRYDKAGNSKGGYDKGGNNKDGYDMQNEKIPDEEAILRLRRKDFYLRNGMQPMDFLVNLFGVEMEIMTYDCTVTFEEYYSILEHLLPAELAAKVRMVD